MAKDLEKSSAVNKAKDKKPAEKKKRKHFWTYFKDMFTEVKKVTWPNKEDMRSYTISVVSFVVVSAIVVGLMDFGLTALMTWLTGTDGLPSLLSGLVG